jgi:hypothetical protein
MQGVPANYRPPCFLIPRKDPFAGEWDPEWVDLRSFVFDHNELSASASAPQIECAAAADAADARAPGGKGQVPASDNVPQRRSNASASASQIECVIAEADAAGPSAPDGRGQVPVSDTSTEMDVTGADLLRSGSSGSSTIGSQHKQQEPIKSAGGPVGSSAKPQRVPKERAPRDQSALLQASVPPALEQISQLSAQASQTRREVAEAVAAGARAPGGRGQAPVSDTSTPQAGSMAEMDVTGADLLRSGSSGSSTIGSQHKQQEPIKSAGGLVGSSAKRVSKERAPGNKSALLQASVPPALPSRMQRIGLPAGENPLVRQLHRDGASTVRRPSKVASKGGRPRRKAAQENKAAKDTEDPLVKLERAVALLDRGLLSVREYELLKQHILTDLLSTALGWPATAQDQGRGGGRPLEDACSFTARERGSSASEVGTGRVREVGSSTPASVRHAKSHTLEPTAAVEPAQHGAKVDGGSRRPPAFAAESLEPISCSPTAVGVTVAVQSHIQVQSKISAETTGGSDNGITNLEFAGALLQQERTPIVSQSDVGSQLQQVCEAQVPRRSTASSVDDGGLGGLQRLELWTGKSQAPERIGILLRLWSLLLRRQGLGLARACSMFSRVLFSFLSPFPLNCVRVCGLSLPLFLSPSLSHHLSLPPSMRGSGRVGRWRGGVRGGGGGGAVCVRAVGGRGVGWGWECMRHVHACALGLGGTEMSLPTVHNGPTH